MEMEKERVLTLEMESGGISAEIAEFQEYGIEVSQELRRLLQTELSEVGNED
jgi:hypothetical protein